MMRSRIVFAVIAGLAGYGALAQLYPRLSPVAGWHYELGRDRARRAAEAVAARLGTDVTGWQAAVAIQGTGDAAQYFRARSPSPALETLVPPVYTRVLFKDPAGKRRLAVAFGVNDKPLEVDRHGFTPVDSPSISNADVGRAALSALLDEETRRLVLPQQPVSATSGDGERFTFSVPASGTTDFTLTAVVEVHGGVATKASIGPSFTSEFRKSLERLSSRNVVLGIPTLLMALALGVLSWGFSVWALLRREVHYRSSIGLMVLILGVGSVPLAVGSVDLMRVRAMTDPARIQQAIADAPTEGQRKGADVGARIGQVVTLLTPLLGLFVVPFWVAGYPLARRTAPISVVTTREFLGGRWLRRPVGAAIGTGILFGGAVAAIPYVVASAGIEPGAILDRDGVELLLFGSSRPELIALKSLLTGTFLVLFGFAAPLLGAHIRHKALARLLLLAIAGCWIAAGTPFLFSLTSKLMSGALVAMLAYALYTRFDLLTLLVAGATARIAIHGAALWVQPSPELSSAGVRVFAGLAVLGGLGFMIGSKGRAVDSSAEAAAIAIRLASAMQGGERKRLLAEFTLARRVQDQMLPTMPSMVDGFGLAASCRPAREVGGDLYEFIPLKDQRYLIAVADVSGKGVQAALYMTMTKGLLGAVAEQVQEPQQIAWSVNEHLFEACARKTFVTLALGVLDTDNRTFCYTRAGHNPPVWRRTRRGETELLRSPGIGLGLVGPRLFNSRTATGSIELEPSDTVVLYSDGIVEAMNAAQEEYGEARLIGAIERAETLDAGSLRDAILNDVDGFIAGAPAHDDMTLVVLRAPAS